MNLKDEGTQDDRGRDGGTNIILKIKKQETRLILHEYDDDNDDKQYYYSGQIRKNKIPGTCTGE